MDVNVVTSQVSADDPEPAPGQKVCDFSTVPRAYVFEMSETRQVCQLPAKRTPGSGRRAVACLIDCYLCRKPRSSREGR